MFKKEKIIFLFLNFLFIFSYSQSIYNSAGKYVKSNGGYIEYNVGELISNTINYANYYFTQGFIQPQNFKVNYINEIKNNFGIVFYPNPVKDILKIQIKNSGINYDNLMVYFYDISGKKMFLNNSYEHNQGKSVLYFNTSKLSGGFYYAVLAVDGKNLASFKFIKQN